MIPADIVFQVPESGTLHESKRKWIARVIASYAGQKMRLRVTRPARSSSANRFLWGLVYGSICRAMAEAGQPLDAEILHEVMKRRYLPRRAVYVMGKEVILPGTTTELDQDQFYDFVLAVCTDPDIEQLGVYIPAPGEYEEEHGKFRSYAIAEPT